MSSKTSQKWKCKQMQMLKDYVHSLSGLETTSEQRFKHKVLITVPGLSSKDNVFIWNLKRVVPLQYSLQIFVEI